MNAGALLQVKDLVKQFGALRATDHVTLDVQPGEIHALIGPNGAGKTSLVAQLSGHLPSDSGQIFFDGHNVTAMPTQVDTTITTSTTPSGQCERRCVA